VKNYKEIANAILTDPNFFQKVENGEIDIPDIKPDTSLRIVKKILKFTDSQTEAVQFVFWTSYLTEFILAKMISKVEKKYRATKIIDSILDRLSLGDKISIFQDQFGLEKKSKSFIGIAWRINDLRNHVAHGRFNKLEYKGLDLCNAKGQLKLLSDLIYYFNNLEK